MSLPQNACGRLQRAMTTGKTRCLLVVLLHVALGCAPAPTSAPAPDATWEMRIAAATYAFLQGDEVEAETQFRAAIEQAEKFAADDPRRARSLNELAVVYSAQGRYADAEPLYKRALAIWEKALGPESPEVATSLNNVASLYQAQGKYADAEPLFTRSLAIAEKALGPEHPQVAASLNNLALLYKHQGRYADAEPLYKRSLAIWEKALGPEHPTVATALRNYAALLREVGRDAEADRLDARAESIGAKSGVGSGP